MTLSDTITDSLPKGYRRLVPGTFQDSSGLTTETRSNPDLINRGFHTANITIYRSLDEGTLQYGIGGKEAFRGIAAQEVGTDNEHIDEFCAQLRREGNYRFTPKQRRMIDGELASDMLFFNPAELGDALILETMVSSYIEVSTQKLAEGRDAFMQEYGELITAIFDKVYGKDIYGKEGVGDLLFENKEIESARIYFLNPKYAKQNAGDDVIARAGERGVSSTGSPALSKMYSYFYATVHGDSVGLNKHLLGVPKEGQTDSSSGASGDSTGPLKVKRYLTHGGIIYQRQRH